MIKIKKFGTFGGVFTPSILTILGVIMYMRLPMIAGEAGLFGTLGIILIAHLISITTGLSVSSIATDKKVKEGGTYYIISRSLGLPIGGTLGLALFVGLSFSVSLYLIGFAESFLGYWDLPMDINHIRIAGSIILILVTIITLISTSLAIKAQYLIMAAIFLSLLSILFGNHSHMPAAPNFFGSGTGVSLMVLFAIFFPSVTGFEAGVSMSGDLRDPKKSIPGGTISAIAIGLAVYIGLAFFFAYTVDGNFLATDPRALFKIALVPQLVIAGIWGATLSSALGSILAAPRILQSTAMDKITPRIFALGTGAAKEPRNALLLTFFIAEAGILIGDLDVIARIVSVFFITTYGFLNLSAAFESLTSADFRPSFKTPPWVSIIGSLACILVMIQLDLLAMIGAVVILGSLFFFLKRRQLVLETGDAWSSVWATLVRTGLSRLNKSVIHTRNWRPNIILFSGQDKARPHLVEFARAFSGRLGLLSAFELVESDDPQLLKDKRYFSSSGKKDELLIHQHKCRDIYSGMDEIARVYGFSGVEPNTILMGWSKNEKNKEKFLRLIRNFEESDFNTTFLYYNPLKKFGNKEKIDVWWSGWGSNLTFSIFLLRHFTAAGEWKDAHIRLLVINNLQERTESLHKTLKQIINHYRINLEIKIINNSIDGLAKHEIISRESDQADLTFIGIPDKQYYHIDQTYEEVMIYSKTLGTFFLVNSSSGFETFDLGLEIREEERKKPQPLLHLDLPELHPSKYHLINEDISKIDINGQKVLTLFSEKTISPLFAEMQYVAGDLKTAVNSVFARLAKMKALSDKYRRTKALIKIKNDFYFHTNRIFTDLTSIKLKILRDALENGITWYIDRLDEDLMKFPLRLKILYEKEDLVPKKNDAVRLKWFKLRRRLAHPFSRKTIQGKIRYHEIAEYYLRNNRHFFLSAFLDKLQDDLFADLSDSRTLITSVDTMLETLLDKPAKKGDFSTVVSAGQKEIEFKIRELESGISIRHEQACHRLLLEFRKNLQLMSNDLGKVDINYRIRQKRRNKKYYGELVQQNSLFAESWYEMTLQQVNRIYLDVLLQSYKSRIKDKINELNLNFAMQLDAYYKAEFQAIRSKLQIFGDTLPDIPGLKINLSSFDEHITLLKDFSRFEDEILKYSETLPESLVITSYRKNDEASGEATEALTVPLRRITRFYIDSRFLGTTHDHLETISQTLKNSILEILDLLSLTRFTLENIPDDMPDKTEVASPVIADAYHKILQEEEKIQQVKEQIVHFFETSLQEVFLQLSAYKMPSTVAEYSQFIREHQGKKVMRTFDAYFERIGSSFNRLSARVLYSRSEGILLAKKIMESEQVSSGNQKFLDLVESVSPKEKVTDLLPQFYKNLFSGQSTISEDFWISRKKDEEVFRTAVRRYQSGIPGGIMIIGGRNSGKTTFCKNITGKLFPKEKVYHLFPLPEGSANPSEFVDEFRRVTKTQGNLNEILESLSQDSVFIIHDVECWWERSTEGWGVVRLLIDLINNYGNKFLFVLNMNTFAFEFINKLIDLQNEFISVIPLRPLDSMELKEMIIRRQRSSSMKFILHKKEEGELSEIEMARLFNRYFDYSEGNPGTALKAWIGNIVRISDHKIHIRPPYIPDTRILSEMDDDWKVVLVQMIVHKWLTYERIQKIFQSDEAWTRAIIGSLSRAGLIEKMKEDLYMVNGFVEPHLMRTFKREGLL
ncbi:MAG: amino acid permease [Bacteroidales bacterium]|nr:amino acid permease [Bacteroidales bacterium]